MKPTRIICSMLLGYLFVFLTAAISMADDVKDAEALVKSAVAYYKANGLEKALDEFSNPRGQFKKGSLYIFVYDVKGTMLAHPNNTLIGQNQVDVPDADGKLFRKDIVTIANSKGSGWADYKYNNPNTMEAEFKTTYFEKIENIIICCGAYKK